MIINTIKMNLEEIIIEIIKEKLISGDEFDKNDYQEIYNSDFSTFDKVLVSDNKYHRDGKNFLVVEKDSYKGNIVTFKSCQANSAYFLCKALNWFQGQIKNDLYVELHGQDTSLDLQGVLGKKLTIGNMLLSETIKPDNINLKHFDYIS